MVNRRGICHKEATVVRAIAPCKDCQVREVGCHAKCKMFKDYKDLQKKNLEASRKDRIVHNMFIKSDLINS